MTVTIQLGWVMYHMGVSKNNGTPKSSILKGFSIINHPYPYFWKHPYQPVSPTACMITAFEHVTRQ